MEKYLDHGQREEASLLRESDSERPELSPWRGLLPRKYDILVAEEATGKPRDDGYEVKLRSEVRKLGAWQCPLSQRPVFEVPSPLGNVDLQEYACRKEDLELL